MVLAHGLRFTWIYQDGDSLGYVDEPGISPGVESMKHRFLNAEVLQNMS